MLINNCCDALIYVNVYISFSNKSGVVIKEDKTYNLNTHCKSNLENVFVANATESTSK